MTLDLDPTGRTSAAPTMPDAADPSRVIALPGTLNLRDVGGYPAATGRRVRARTLLRSAAMHGLGDEARAELRRIGVRTIVDLREDAEVAHEPNALGDLPVTTQRIPIFSTGLAVAGTPGAAPAGPADAGGAIADGVRAAEAAGAGVTLGDIYDFLLDGRGERLTAAVVALAEPGALPAIVHCSAGKDRTGLTVMLVLDLLGVPDDVIAADYALTEKLISAEAQVALRRLTEQTARGDGPLPNDLLDSPPELILRALAKVRAAHGDARGYLLAHGASAESLDALVDALTEPV